MKTSEITKALSFILNDKNEVTYPRSYMISAINNGCRMISLMRPDSSSENAIVELIEGVKQTLPEKAIRLFDSCYCNNQPIEMISRKDLDRFVPDWMESEPSNQITELMYDERVPHTYYVYPPALAGTKIELSYSIMPTKIVDVEDKFPVIEKYIPAVMEWVLYLMFSRDAENSMNQQRAADHRQQFYNILQIKTVTDYNFAPQANKPGSGQQQGVT